MFIAKLISDKDEFLRHIPTASSRDCLEVFSLKSTTWRLQDLSWYLLQITILGKAARLRSAVEVFREVVTVASW